MTPFAIESVILGLLGVVCALLSYWAIRLENRIAYLESALVDLREQIPREYITKLDYRERTRDMFEMLRSASVKLEAIKAIQNCKQ